MTPGRLGVYTTVYPGVEPFLADWHRSVAAQTDRDFDLWIGLDLLEPDAVRRAVGGAVDAHWVPGDPGDRPAQVRSRAIAAMVERYPAVVFVDSDDVLHPTRVQAARAALADADVAACALAIGDADARDLGLRFGPADGDGRALIARCNVFGLSNTAYRSAVLQDCLPVPDGCVLYDWLLATRAWAAGASMTFDREPRMTYRQHGANIAGVLPPFSAAYVARACALVLAHYDFALDPAWPMDAARRGELEAARARASRFRSGALSSPGRLERYVDALNALEPEYVWWWPVAHPDLEELWSN